MATDAELLEQASPQMGVWRWYSWSTPTVSFGRNERTADRYSAASVEAAGLAAVRRPTGGRALLHAREITYSATFGVASTVGWREAYDAVNSILLATLQALGVAAERAPAQAPLRPDGPICFDQPAEGELVVNGRKLVGSAVWRHGVGYLQHGSILLHDDQSRLMSAAIAPLPPPPPAAALLDPGTPTVRRLSALDASTIGGVLDGALRHELAQDASVTSFAPSASLQESIANRRHEFIDPARLWRR